MKCCIVTGIFPPDIGGPASYVPVIARALAERGHDVRVVTTSEPEHLGHEDREPFPVVRVNRRLPLRRRFLHTLSHLRRWGREADAIYANGIFPESSLSARLLRKPLVMKIVADPAWERASRRGWTAAGFEAFQSHRQGWQAELLKRLRSGCVRRADAIIVPSQYLRRIVQRWGVAPERVCVVYNATEGRSPDLLSISRGTGGRPIDLDARRSTLDGIVERPELSVERPPTRVLTAGRLIPLKGVDRLIRILPRLPEVLLTVAGDGPCRQEWQDLARAQGVQERVCFTGTLSHEQLIAAMRSHDLFVLASTHEGLPHVILEAMGQGRPVVASRVGGIPEIIEDGVNGLLVEPDERSLHEGLRQVLESAALRERLSVQARRTIETTFSFKAMVDQTEAILIRIGSSGPRL